MAEPGARESACWKEQDVGVDPQVRETREKHLHRNHHHLAVGKVSMEAPQIVENARVVLDEVGKKRPADLKGDFFKSVAVSSTMGPGVRVNMKG